jgi:hypothetical protein
MSVTANNSDADKIAVPSKPHMPPVAVEFLRQKMLSSHCYLEYGSGGSTRMAAKLNVPFVFSVESDQKFGKEVRRRVSHETRSKTAFKMVCPNIGPTGPWGYPKGAQDCAKWHLYITQVWQAIWNENLVPDLILIDGRFRAACFLFSLLNSKPGSTIVFDDYRGREERYAVAEQYARPVRTLDRVAVFERPKTINPSALIADLMKYASQPG